MEKVRGFFEKTINLSKKTFLSSYDEKPNIPVVAALDCNNPAIKNTMKSKSETDLDKLRVAEETWGWFIDPKDIMNVTYKRDMTFK